MKMKKIHRLLVALVAGLLAACSAMAEKPRHQEHTLQHGGQERSYVVYASKNTKQPRAMMLVLHGGLGNAEETANTTLMHEVAAKHNFIVVYPNGIGGKLKLMKNRRTWNAGACCGPAVKNNVNDVDFLGKVIDQVASTYNGNRKQVYVTGMSNGAMMAYRMACEAPEKIAAIIPVSGTLAMDSCKGANSVALLHIHGSEDSNVPLQGGKGKTSIAGVKHNSVLKTIDTLVQQRQCSVPQQTREGSSVIKSYDCKNGADLVFRLVEGGEHVWPGGNSRRNKKLSNGNFSGSEVAWEFARQYSK
jgi:polyhydroxybutyrate depolymerase